jgi:dTDP-glucose 4,6-dehydratase
MTPERTLLVTGGAGFIGSRFVTRHLDQHPSDRVIVLDALASGGRLDTLPSALLESHRCDFVHGDVRNADLVESLVARSDAVVHFAAATRVPRSLSDQRLVFENDFIGTHTVAAQVLRQRHRVDRLIHVSSGEIYGSTHVDLIAENHPLEPSTPEAAARCAADRLIYALSQSSDLPAIILRPFSNYGPRQSLEGLVPRCIASALLDEPLLVHGDGLAARDWIYVDDTCDALERALDAPLAGVRGEVFNIGTGRATGILSVAREVLRLLDKSEDLITHTPDRPGQMSLHRADVKKAATKLGFDARTALADGLAATVAWYRNNTDWWEPHLWMRSVLVADSDGQITYW